MSRSPQPVPARQQPHRFMAPPRSAWLMQHTLLMSAAQAGDAEAIVCGDQRWTYSQLLAESLRLATVLQRIGLKRGDRVAVFMENSVETAISIYGTWLAGGVIVVINPQTKQDKLRFVLQDSGAAVLLSNALLDRIYREAARNVPSLRATISVAAGAVQPDVLDWQEELASQEERLINPGVIPLDLAALIYTSGSTGEPKGVMMTHQNMLFTGQSLIEYLRMDSSERILNVLPLAFDYGLYQLLMSVLLGSTLILEANFAFPALIFKRLAAERVTVLPGVPTLFATLVSLQKRSPQMFPDVRRITNTAAHLPDDFVPTLKSMFPEALVFKMYGLTECKRVSFLEPELVETKPGSVGKAIPGTEVFLLDEDGRSVQPGETGVLHVRGPHVMPGYWNRPDLSAHMLREGRYPGERVLCTHDFFRQDSDGFLYFMGRNDDIIKTRGEKVSPVEVENALHSIPGVREAAVKGQHDELQGEVVTAWIVQEEGAELSEADIRRQALLRLEPFMVPSVVRFVSDLPRTATGKVRKQSLEIIREREGHE